MPRIIIQIDEHQEAKIIDFINKRQSFRLIGATIRDSDLKDVFMQGIEFHFMEPDAYMKSEKVLNHLQQEGLDHMRRDGIEVVERGGPLDTHNRGEENDE
jgi:hypothetical protein